MSDDETPIVPSRAAGSRKGEAPPAGTRFAGRLRLKPSADSEDRVEPPKNKRPVKPAGRHSEPRSGGRGPAKPPGAEGSQEQPPSKPSRGRDLADQVARRRRRGSAGSESPAGYVRFRVHVEDGVMSVVDSHFVDSTLVLPSRLQSEYLYEVTDGTRLLHADALPDLGVVRSFADPEGTPQQRRHHIYRPSAYDFDVRVPAAELTRASMPKLEIVLYRAKQLAPTGTVVAAAPLGVQFEHELREVMRLSGIPHSLLPSALKGTSRR